MLFTDAQHRRGLLRWLHEDVSIEIEEAVGRHLITAEGIMSNGQSFRFLDEPLGPGRSITLRGSRPWKSTGGIAWYEETQDNGMFRSDLWDWDVKDKQLRLIRLAHVPDYGVYHQLVVDAGNLEWPENIHLRYGRDFVRLIVGTVFGPWTKGISREGGNTADYEVTVNVTYEPLEGRFIEVVANGEDPSAARVRALALLGYVNLLLSPGAYGRIVIDAAIDARRPHRQSYTLFDEQLLNYRVEIDDLALEAFETDLQKLSQLNGKSRSMHALERYGQAMSSTSEEMRFVALVSGIDAIVTGFYNERKGGDLGAKRRRGAESLISERLLDIDEQTKKRIFDLLSSPSFLDKVTFYVTSVGLDKHLIEDFRSIRIQRGSLFHGGKSQNLGKSVVDATKILEALICKETGIDPKRVWKLNRSFTSVGQFSFEGFGWELEPS
jgi:hypothetical protein